jgi:sterol desaturase/sphingolipid hydroxylase (fatty acid hydroxylase superfamily)
MLELLALLVLPVFLALDLVYGARRQPTSRGWRLRGIAVAVLTYYVTLWTGQLWGRWLPAASLFDGAALGTVGGALVGVLVYELVHYAYHRAAHSWNWLWRAGHQMHHSAERLDVFGANYMHPLDTALFTTWAVLVFFPLLGLSPEAAGLANLFLVFNAVFQHANVRTPRWLGFLIQRPESHAIHHARGVHASNYADLPLWDFVFGTLRNPGADQQDRELQPEQGFYAGASSRLLEMLAFRDVSRPREGDRTRPAERAAQREVVLSN